MRIFIKNPKNAIITPIKQNGMIKFLVILSLFISFFNFELQSKNDKELLGFYGKRSMTVEEPGYEKEIISLQSNDRKTFNSFLHNKKNISPANKLPYFNYNLPNSDINMIKKSHDFFSYQLNLEAGKGKNPFKIANRAFYSPDSIGNYLLPIERLSSIKDSLSEKREKMIYLQAALTYHSFLQNNGSFDSLIRKWYPKKEKINSEDSLMLGTEARDTIINLAKDKRIILFNESHFLPKHRYLVSSFLKDFYQLGFRYLAVEALWYKDLNINKRGYPIVKSGFYTRTRNGQLNQKCCKSGIQIDPI